MHTPFTFPNKLLEQWNGCQRNWNYDKPVELDHAKMLVDIARSTPSKNNLNLLSIQAFENSPKTLQAISEIAKGSPSEAAKTSAAAPLTIAIGWRQDRHKFLQEDHLHDWLEIKNRHTDEYGTRNTEGQEKELEKVTYTYVGVIAGAVSYKANELGYKTGVNTCFLRNSRMVYGKDHLIMTIGIGYPLYEDHARRSETNNGKNSQGPQRTKMTAPFIHVRNEKIIVDEK